MYKITVFTATYNRVNLLPKLYKSLKNQTNKHFEWLIVDDDSTDSTEKLVNRWINEEKCFEIRYIKQNHGGKHRALNKGFFEAKGEYFFIVDSDDYLLNDAIETIYSWIEQIDKSNERLAGISGLRVYENGEINGGVPKVNSNGWIDADCFSREKYNLGGDKAEVFRTDILRTHLFPEFEGEFFVTEDVCWNSIYKDKYKLRWFNKAIYVCEYLEDGLTRTGMNEISGHINNYNGYCYYVKQCIDLFGIMNRPRVFNSFIKVARNKNRNFSNMAIDLNMSKIELLSKCILLPFAFSKSAIKILKKEGLEGIKRRITN